jgi:hypothetical protein
MNIIGKKINIDVFHGAQKSMDSVSSSYTNHPSREKNPSYYMEFHHNEEDHHKTRKQQGDEMSMNGGRSPISSSPYDKDHNELENEEEGVQSPFQRTKAVARTDVVIADKVAVPRDHSFSSSSAYFSSSIQDEAENQQDEEMQKQNYDDQKEQMLIISKTNQQDEMAASCFTAAVATNTSPMPPPPAADHFLNTSFTINIMAEEYLNPRMEEITKMIHEVEGYWMISTMSRSKMQFLWTILSWPELIFSCQSAVQE